MLAAEYKFAQYHNQAAIGTLHRNLVALWDAIRAETGGRVEAVVHPENNGVPGGDPAALKMILSGEIAFFALMGGGAGSVVPVAEVQQVPFAFRSPADAHRVVDGPLGRFIAEEMAAKGLHLFRFGGFDNGMRQLTTLDKPVVSPADIVGMKVRVPPGQVISDTFKAFGAEPVTTPANAIYRALKDRAVDAQENPLGIVEAFKLDELVKYISLTNHAWSGFNLMAHRPTFDRLPGDIQAAIDRNVTKFVRRQRLDQAERNASLRQRFAGQGIVFNEVDQDAFRGRLAGLYATWKEKLGSKCWSLLETEVGKLG